MRDLTLNEINDISGAGQFGNIGKTIGISIGQSVDAIMTSINGHVPNPSFAPPAGQIGEGIGDIIDLDITGAINNIGLGITGIISTIKANNNQPA